MCTSARENEGPGTMTRGVAWPMQTARVVVVGEAARDDKAERLSERARVCTVHADESGLCACTWTAGLDEGEHARVADTTVCLRARAHTHTKVRWRGE